MTRRRHDWKPSAEQMRLWPAVSGNAINGLGEEHFRRPSPIYWQAPDSTPHGPLQLWFYQRPMPDGMAEARRERQKWIDAPLAPIAAERAERAPAEWTREVERVAKECAADIVGVTAMKAAWVFEGSSVPPQRWVVMFGVAHDYEAMKTAPEGPSNAEVIRQYARAMRAAKGVASWIRSQGWDAVPHAGPSAGAFVMIPPALECGFGELGKHGSIIHRELGSSFRLSCVLTDLPLVPTARDEFGADDFCTRCQLCSDECPPDAIPPEKQLVRGERRWYVDLDKCLPYFNEHGGCGICIAVCPWSRPGVAPTLLTKLARRRGE